MSFAKLFCLSAISTRHWFAGEKAACYDGTQKGLDADEVFCAG